MTRFAKAEFRKVAGDIADSGSADTMSRAPAPEPEPGSREALAAQLEAWAGAMREAAGDPMEAIEYVELCQRAAAALRARPAWDRERPSDEDEAEDRIRGEWFHASRELRAFIASFLQDMATPVAFRNPHSEGPWHPLDPPGTP